ncbi:MAG: LysR family transcriptional regulator [Lachnospiraceae bacterium]|nr:LysR family transcriptional regulator [Lachnospiraceae bacterium]
MLAHAYEYACAIETHRNISKAAAALCITQSALTKYINRLEEDLNIRLFDRSVSPIALTDAGCLFLEKAHTILNMEQELLGGLGRITNSPQGTLSLGITTEMCSIALPYILPRFRQLYPNIRVQITEGSNRFLMKELHQERIELVFMASPDPSDDLITECIQEETLLLAMPIDHPVAHSFDLSTNSPLMPYYLEPERIRNGDFVVCSADLGMGRFANEMFRKYRLEPNITLEMKRNEAALRMASTGAGMIFTPVRTPLRIHLLKPMAYFSIEQPLSTRKRCICYNRHTSLSQSAVLFLPVLRQIFLDESELRPPLVQLLHQPTAEAMHHTTKRPPHQ